MHTGATISFLLSESLHHKLTNIQSKYSVLYDATVEDVYLSLHMEMEPMRELNTYKACDFASGQGVVSFNSSMGEVSHILNQS